MRKRILIAAGTAATAALLALPMTAVASPHTLCVGGPGCFPTLASALAAANDGDTVRLAPGIYAGGVTVTHSISLIGSGAARTVIRGGGPVLTIGSFQAQSEPTVSVSGVTITGGHATTNPAAAASGLPAGALAFGGGIEIPPAANSGPGAVVTITNAAITGNSAAPTASAPVGPPCPGGVACAFAQAAGGGIDNSGALTILDSTVSGNGAGSPAGVASDADGGGIATFAGSLTLVGSLVSNNTAEAVAPDGRYAEGGGIFMSDGTALTIRSSAVTSNATVLQNTFPYSLGGGQTLDMSSNSGGIHFGDDVTATIDSTHIDGNTITVDDPNGEPTAFDAGLCLCTDDDVSSTLTLRNSTVDYNRVAVTVASQADVFPGSGSALELDGPGTVSGTQVTGNTVRVFALAGDAIAEGGIAVADGSTPVEIDNSAIFGNVTTAIAPHGTAEVLGAGMMNQGPTVLANDAVTHNLAIVLGETDIAQGGGIFNGQTWFGPGPLTLENTTVTHNVLTGPPGSTLQGAGIFTLAPSTTTLQCTSSVSANTPDDCFGGGC
jgi:hypothetical protein